MDQFKQISTFVNVASQGSLSAAARHEGIAPAMVGRRLDALEARLGIKLTQRTTRSLTLTAEGVAFLEDCQRILRDLDEAEGAISARSQTATGQLRITAPAGFGRQYIAPMIPRLVCRHPRLSVALDLSDRVSDLIAEGFDCAIRFGEQADSTLVRTKLGEACRVVVASPDYLRRCGEPQTPADLARHQCLSFNDGATPQRGWSFKGGSRADPQRTGSLLTCNDGAVLHEWSLAGMGLAWRSLWEVGADLAGGRLVRVLRPFEAEPTAIYCVFPARKHLPLRTRIFVDFIKDEFAAPPFVNALAGTPPAPLPLSGLRRARTHQTERR
ncbi:MAG: LysR substrate-binding domain-containing protein [Burkholderiaceae bacterium]